MNFCNLHLEDISNLYGLKHSVINNIDDIYQSIHDLLINPDQRKQLGMSAQKRALEDFNWDIVTKKYLDAINN